MPLDRAAVGPRDRERLSCLLRLDGLRLAAVPTWVPPEWGPARLERYLSEPGAFFYTITSSQGRRGMELTGRHGRFGAEEELQKPLQVRTLVLGTVLLARSPVDPTLLYTEDVEIQKAGPGVPFSPEERPAGSLSLIVSFQSGGVSPETASRFLRSVRLVRP